MKNFLAMMAIIGMITLLSCDSKPAFIWQAATNPLLTEWAADVDPDLPWPEYPRPQMVRQEWINLNGLWDYTLSSGSETPQDFTSKILVPYPVESALSGLADSVGPDDLIWYRREFVIPDHWVGKTVLLHFEAADWETNVYVNGEYVGVHRGGYDPFSFDLTDVIEYDTDNEIRVCVSDPSNEGFQPRGKQKLKPGGIWYTPSSGIWQTVWLEAVPDSRIDHFYITPYPDDALVEVQINTVNTMENDQLQLTVLNGDTEWVNGIYGIEGIIRMQMRDFLWWSPDNPHLYDMKIKLLRNGQVLDEVSTYFGMRSIKKDMAEDGFVRLYLNGEVLFHNGTLDQGFWPDGLYTPPTDEAMKFDIAATKEMGFNMLRKHVKIENRRFYYWCDKLGIMVWQDMPSTTGYVAPDKPDLIRPEKEVEQFKTELKKMIRTKYNHPSIVMWVPFNEGWGQFDTKGVVDFIYDLDPSRLVNNTSGWADRGVGDVVDIHHYPDPRYPEPEQDRASVLGEFGGLGYLVEGHTWKKNNWGYRQMSDSASLLLTYEAFYTMVWQFMENNGLAAAVYTQTTDVETETNGLITYDRKVMKMDPDILRKINTNNYVPAPAFLDDGNNGAFRNSTDVVIAPSPYIIRYTLDGSDPGIESPVYSEPITLKNTAIVRAAAFNDKGEQSLVAVKGYTLASAAPPIYLKPYDSRYSGGGHFALTDGEYGGIKYSDGKWQGYRDNDLDIVIDLGTKIKVNSVAGNFLLHPEGWIFLPERFQVYLSDDGKEFISLKEIITHPPSKMIDPDIKMIKADSLDIETRYLRITASTIGKVPDWHEGGGGKRAWMFIDEVVIE